MFNRIFLLTLVLLTFGLFSNINAATYTVDRADDAAGANACTAAANDCSLRGAMNNANSNGVGADIINFNVGGGNSQTINITASLPEIQTSLTIDGTTQPLFGGLPLIEINGFNAGGASDGFSISTALFTNAPLTVTIKSLVINLFKQHGIFFNANSGVTATVVGCYIGTSAGGSVDLGNGGSGIRIAAYNDSVFAIGGTGANERNVISGNEANGINVSVSGDLINANTDVKILNNFIGTNAAGTADLGNTLNGVKFSGAGSGYSLQVGSGLSNGRNVISGNNQSGISASIGALTIVGNYIGTNLNGTVDVGNTLDGIELSDGVSSATIGGTVIGVGVGNLISGNNRDGFRISDASVPATIRRNLIGTNAAGTAKLANAGSGIFLSESDATTSSSIVVGSDTNALDGNVISGNTNYGIDIDAKVNGVKIYGNKIGTNSAGNAAMSNFGGLRILSANNSIGEAGNAVAANVISGNSQNGILLGGSTASGNQILNNFIGTNASGDNLGNLVDGVLFIDNAHDNSIGSAASGSGNAIAFNNFRAVTVASGTGNSIRANSIYSNGAIGLDLGDDGLTPNDAGDSDAGANNLQNFPVLINASSVQLAGTLESAPNKPFTVDFYRVDSCDASGFGEGRYFIASKTVNVINSGTSYFNFLDVPLTVGQIIVATATDAGGSTSEFSPCYTVNPPPGVLSFSAAAYNANEASGTRTIVVNRTNGSYGTIQVNYATSNLTAAAGQDYTAASGTLIFNNGEVTKSFDIPIAEDWLDETDETVKLTLSFPTNGSYLVNPTTAVLTIQDNDPTPTVSIDDVSQFEGNIGTNQYTFHVSLSAPSGQPVSVDYATANGTATGSTDYAVTGGQLNFAQGETTKTIVVTINGDLTPELDETFFVNLSNSANATFAKSQGVGTIQDDDNPGKFKFSFAPYSGTEHDSVVVTVSRANGTAGTVSVDYATSGGTATSGADYTPASGTLIFGDGETAKTFNVSISDDNIPEPAETVNLVLSNPIGGAGLGAPAIAVLNIIDNDNGTLLNIGGEVRKADNTPVASVTMTLQGAQNATTMTDAQGKYSFANLAPDSNYTVTPSAIGFTFAPINRQFNNLSADITNANFTATAAPSRQLRVIGGEATPGQNITATIELVAQGDENSAGFSLNYDPAILTNPQVTLGADALAGNLTANNSQAGKLGVLLALPAGQNFAPGTKQIAVVTFDTLPTAAYNSPVTFGDAPIVRQVVNSNADPLPTNYLDGAVIFAQGYEADVAPRPTGSGNGSVTVTDFTQVGRFVAGLDATNANYNEYQRADCAPRISLGNGQMTVSDYTQAGRYAAGLDVATPTGGQIVPSFAKPFFAEDDDDPNKSQSAQTIVRVVNNQASPGAQVLVSIETDTQGTENGFGFTLSYDAAKLSNPLVQKGTDTQAATLIPNTAQTGKVGVVLGMPFGVALTAGTKQLVTIRFNVAANAASGQTALKFGDAPVVREISDVDANVLTSNFTDGSINILGPTAAEVSFGGRVATASGRGVFNAGVTLTRDNGETRLVTTDADGYYRFANVPAGETFVLNVRAKRYQFSQPTLVLTLFDDGDDINFVAAGIKELRGF